MMQPNRASPRHLTVNVEIYWIYNFCSKLKIRSLDGQKYKIQSEGSETKVEL